jgi:hypothetical protein
MDDDREHTARSRQLARLPVGKKPPGPRAALAMAKSRAYQAAADAPATLRAYKTDLENFKAWFKSPRQVQRFLFTHDQIANVFARRPNQDTAAKFHSARNQAFTTWAEVTGVAMAA